MRGLKIHISSFMLNQNIVQGSDKVRISVTTFPEENKELYTMEAKKLSDSHHMFSINITDQTRKILFVFRKKNIFQNDPIIASTIINASEFPYPDDSKNTEVKTIKIYEPIQKMSYDRQNRQVVGQMEIKFTITDPEYAFGDNVKIQKIHNGQGYSKVKVITRNENENQGENYSIFDEY